MAGEDGQAGGGDRTNSVTVVTRSHGVKENDRTASSSSSLALPLLPLMALFYGQPMRNFPTFAEMKLALKSATPPEMNPTSSTAPVTASSSSASSLASLRRKWRKMMSKVLYANADADLKTMLNDGRVRLGRCFRWWVPMLLAMWFAMLFSMLLTMLFAMLLPLLFLWLHAMLLVSMIFPKSLNWLL